MKFIHCFCFASLLLLALIELVESTCVLESDFGFKINCAFKKSGLFRVRNLGGLKAHASLGFSLGDELGFEQSLTNMDPSRRRSVSLQNGAPFNLISDPTVGSAVKQEKRGKQNRVMTRPMAPSGSKQAAMDKLTSLHRHASSTMRPIVVSATTMHVPNTWTGINPTMTMAKPLSMGVPPFKPLPPKEDTLKVLPVTALTKNSYTKQQIPQSKGPGLFYNNPVPVNHQVNYQANNLAGYYPVYNTKKVDNYNSITGYGDDTTPIRFNKEDINAKIAEIVKVGNISMEAVEAAILLRQQQLLNKYANMPLPTTTMTTTTTQRTTTTEQPLIFHPEPEPDIIKTIMTQKPKRNPAAGKVMNAPREYYPVGYEKNFDDHFQSKVDLPDTNFHCGEQKYFPGLYGDEGLGCMVFHVCALTDEGLVMKSFLCPESTLFDQTILKCNWWFYVDCKNTRRLYDTNMPVSKSYELMKALTFFSSYKKEMQEDTNPEDVEGIKEAILILENQDSPRTTQSSNSPDAFHVITPRPIIDERNNHKVDVITGNSSVSVANRSHSSTNNNVTRRISAKRKSPESRMQNSEYKLVTVNADLNFNNQSDSLEDQSGVASSGSAETKSVVSSSGSSETKSAVETSEIAERKYRRRMTLQKNSTSTTNHPPVKRVYRSSAEIKEDKDRNLNSENLQTTKPTSVAKLVGEFPTPSATIAKLDEAILGTKVKREVITIFPQHRDHI